MNVKEMFGLDLPAQVPYFGFDEPYIIGNGIIMSGGLSNGTWDYCTGYAYGDVYNFFKRERVKIYIDSRPFTLQGEMHRALNTGIFYSVQQFRKAAVCLVDFSLQNQPFSARLIAVKNTSNQDIVIHPYAEVKFPLDKYTWGISNTALHILQKDYSWLSISFGGCETHVTYYANFFRSEAILRGNDITMAPGEVRYFTLFHDARICPLAPGQQEVRIEDARAFELPFEPIDRKGNNGLELLQECIAEWLKWSAAGLDTSFIPDERSRMIIDSVTVIERMLQGSDGGVMATPRVYTACYLRDAFCAMKGMLAAQRYPEVKKFLEYQLGVYNKHIARGEFAVPTSAQIGGGDGVFFGFGDEENWSCESPGLLAILMRDYYRVTADLDCMKTMEALLRYCIDVQLKHAEKHGWKMYFNNDETESQGNGAVLKELVDFEKKWYSMISSVICIASTEFLIDYLGLTGRGGTDECSEYKRKLDNMIKALDENYWREDLGIYHWFRTPNGDWPKTLMSNYHIMPLYYDAPVNKDRAIRSAKKMIEYWDPDTGFIPNQIFGENEDFCGHNMGYLLYMASVLKLPEADAIYNSLVRGKSISAYGMWCETYYDDGTPYQGPTTYDNKMHNFRCFESGLNLEAIIQYWKSKQG
ncbi:MAG TPA: hypothetical protein PLZ84_06140 [Clostridia bacterium]|nr:hypothetical protein [Clostridia bacterium]